MRALPAIACILLASTAHAYTQNERLAALQQVAPDPDAQTYFRQLAKNGCPATTPFKRAVVNYVVAEKGAGNWGSQDFAYITMFGQCVAGTNLAQPALYKITWNGACTFTGPTGLSGDGSTCYGDTGVNQNALTKASQNSARIDECASGGGGPNIVGSNGSTSSLSITVAANSNSKVMTNTAVTDTGSSGAGCRAAWRASSSTVTTVYNGAVLSNGVANTSSAPGAVTTTVCKVNTTLCLAGNQIYWISVGAPIASEAAHYNNLIVLLRALGETKI